MNFYKAQAIMVKMWVSVSVDYYSSNKERVIWNRAKIGKQDKLR